VITDVEGVRVGHWSDLVARTGCTVVRFPEATTASGEVRGGAPATREFELLAPTRTVTRLDAVVLSGGSAFGLAAADGVVRVLEADGTGFATPAGSVPIVVGLSLYDLGEGDASVRPGPDAGAFAAEAAKAGPFAVGRVGAGTGATVDKWRGPDGRRPGGLGTATVVEGDLVVAVLVAVNASGSIDDGTASAAPVDLSRLRRDPFEDPGVGAETNTTIGVIATNARLDKVGCHLVAEGGHDGLARAVFPPHTTSDGDALVAAATGSIDAPVDLVRVMALMAVEQAVRHVAVDGAGDGSPPGDRRPHAQ
jgi:L-aminopeptidase/D-esterase-like protein